MTPAIFLDRDGVLNVNRKNYVKTLDELIMLENALTAMPLLKDSGFKIIIVTNQSGVDKGIFSREIADTVNNAVVSAIEEAGGRIDAVYYCPHDYLVFNCDCRKPAPGMILTAAQDHDIDLSTSYLIGDSLTDLQAGRNAGIPAENTFLLRTGRGIPQLTLPEAKTMPLFEVFDDLLSATQHILSASSN